MSIIANVGDFISEGTFIMILLGLGIFIFSFAIRFVSLWFQALVSGAPISLLNIIGINLRKIPPKVIVGALINLRKSGNKAVSTSDLETHYLAGGNVSEVVGAMIASGKANIPLDWGQATAINLAGRYILDAVRTSVTPSVIDVPGQNHVT